jgi:hypothetical protein
MFTLQHDCWTQPARRLDKRAALPRHDPQGGLALDRIEDIERETWGTRK